MIYESLLFTFEGSIPNPNPKPPPAEGASKGTWQGQRGQRGSQAHLDSHPSSLSPWRAGRALIPIPHLQAQK